MSRHYRPRRARSSPLWQCLRDSMESFTSGFYPDRYKYLGPLDSSRETALRDSLRCGDLASSFLRVQCPDCDPLKCPCCGSEMRPHKPAQARSRSGPNTPSTRTPRSLGANYPDQSLHTPCTTIHRPLDPRRIRWHRHRPRPRERRRLDAHRSTLQTRTARVGRSHGCSEAPSRGDPATRRRPDAGNRRSRSLGTG